MGKRSSFERIERDFYPTPYKAVEPLLPHLVAKSRFAEPCAGNGALMKHLGWKGHICVWASDIEPRAVGIHENDAETCGKGDADMFITNPPWNREILHSIILNLSRQAPTWLLFDADWLHTIQSKPFIPRLRKIVSVGRVKWIENSPSVGKDNCCWYLFAQGDGAPIFIGR